MITGALRVALDQLTAAGIRATADLRAALPPCVLVELVSVERATLTAYRVELQLVAMATNSGSDSHTDQLDTLLGQLLRAPLSLGRRWDAVRIDALDGGDPLPALRTAMTLLVTDNTRE